MVFVLRLNSLDYAHIVCIFGDTYQPFVFRVALYCLRHKAAATAVGAGVVGAGGFVAGAVGTTSLEQPPVVLLLVRLVPPSLEQPPVVLSLVRSAPPSLEQPPVVLSLVDTLSSSSAATGGFAPPPYLSRTHCRKSRWGRMYLASA